MKFTIFLITLSSLLFVGGCNSKNSSNSISDNHTTGIVELGRVKNSHIDVMSLDGYVLYSTETGNDGEFEINITDLKKSIKKYNDNIKFVKIVSSGGIDVDPNRDDIIEDGKQRQVHGSFNAIIPIVSVYGDDGYSVNLLTSFVSDLVSEVRNLDQEYLDLVSRNVKAIDANADGKISYKDLIHQNISENNSELELDLRMKYFESIYSGDNNQRNSIVNNLRKYFGLSMSKITINDDVYTINLMPSRLNNEIRYGMSNNEQEPAIGQIYSQELQIKENTTLYLVECEVNSTENCNQLQKIFFKENSYYLDAIQEEDNNLNLGDIIYEKEQIVEDIKVLNSEIEDIDAELVNGDLL